MTTKLFLPTKTTRTTLNSFLTTNADQYFDEISIIHTISRRIYKGRFVRYAEYFLTTNHVDYTD